MGSEVVVAEGAPRCSQAFLRHVALAGRAVPVRWGPGPAPGGAAGRGPPPGLRGALRVPLRVPLVRPGRSSVPRGRACILAGLLFVYLLGVLLLSTVGFSGQGADKGIPVPELTGFPYGLAGGRRIPFPRGVMGGGPVGAVGRSRLHWCQPLHFMDDTNPRPVTALASFPGSGNTWLRYLLQQATGIYTGSVYKDYGLLKNGFPAESVSNGSVLVVKTHEWGPAARTPFHRVILLVREPGPAIQAEFNRQSGGHIGFAALDRYRLKKGKFWANFVTAKLSAWRLTNMDWLTNFTGPTHVVLYEQLVSDVEGTLRGIFAFLEHSVSESELACALERREGIYRRKRRSASASFDPFTRDMRTALNEQQEEVFREVKKFQELATS